VIYNSERHRVRTYLVVIYPQNMSLGRIGKRTGNYSCTPSIAAMSATSKKIQANQLIPTVPKPKINWTDGDPDLSF